MKEARYQPRTRIVPKDDPWLTHETTNPMARSLGSSFRRAFEAEILPYSGEFDPDKSPLYVPTRTWIHGTPSPTPPAGLHDHHYEELLFQHFWNGDQGTLVLIEGFPGCGKSTLMKYFFRSYCARHPQKSRVTSHAADVKLFLHVDLGTATSPEDFDRLLYTRVKERVLLACESKGFDIERDLEYSMWDHFFRWSATVHADAERASPDRASYRAKLVTSHPSYTDARVWCHAALTYLSACISGRHPGSANPFTKIVLCLDNLDQTPIEVQLHALLHAKRWVGPESEFKLWRAYVPLWPATLHNIMPRIEPLPDRTTIIQLGSLDPTLFLTRRAEWIRGEIGNLQNLGLTSVPTDYPNEAILLEDCDAVVSEALLHSREPYKGIVAGIAGGSARRELALWQSTLSSQSLHDTVKSSRGEQQRATPPVSASGRKSATRPKEEAALRINPTPLLDALVTGHYLAHHGEHSLILNLFSVGDDPRTCHDLLLGMHTLHMIDGRGRSTFETVASPLRVLGYEAEQLDCCLSRFNRAHITSWLMPQPTSRPFLVTQSTINGYVRLVRQKVYIDNMALTTPVSAHAAQRMKRTRYPNPDEFFDRLYTSLEFLVQFADAEEDFCDPELQGGKDERLALLKDLRFPCWSKILAKEYLAHVKAIEPKVFGDLKERFTTEMPNIASHRLFARTSRYPDTLINGLGGERDI